MCTKYAPILYTSTERKSQHREELHAAVKLLPAAIDSVEGSSHEGTIVLSPATRPAYTDMARAGHEMNVLKIEFVR